MSTQKAANDLVSPLEAASLPIAQPRRNAGWIFELRWTAATWYPFGGIIGNDVGQSITMITLCGLVGGAITGYPLMRALQQSSIQNPKPEI
jgi:hypothetical protein